MWKLAHGLISASRIEKQSISHAHMAEYIRKYIRTFMRGLQGPQNIKGRRGHQKKKKFLPDRTTLVNQGE